MTSIINDTPAAAPLALAEVDRLADEIAEVASLIDTATHRLLTLIRRFDEGSGWAQHGALSCAHWLSWRIGLDMGAARERVRVARALGTLPLLDDTLRHGAISYAKARAITRVATPTNEATLVEMAQHATGAQLERICRGYRRVRARLESERPDSPTDEMQRRFVHTTDTDDGMVRVEARLHPEEAALLMQAIDVARRAAWRQRTPADVSAETPPPALARADALVLLAETFLSSAAGDGAARVERAVPVELVVHVAEAALTVDVADSDAPSIGGAPDLTHHHATLADGTAITIATAQRLACDAAVVRVTEDADGDVCTLTRRTRRISTTLRRALRLRDDGCRFPGCTNRITDAHHVRPWARGGATTLANLCSLCRRHHRIVHEHGYRIERAADGELCFFRRDGSAVPTIDARLPRAVDALGALRQANAARDVVIDADTAFPRWDGTAVDYALAVDSLLAVEQPGVTAT